MKEKLSLLVLMISCAMYAAEDRDIGALYSSLTGDSHEQLWSISDYGDSVIAYVNCDTVPAGKYTGGGVHVDDDFKEFLVPKDDGIYKVAFVLDSNEPGFVFKRDYLDKLMHGFSRNSINRESVTVLIYSLLGVSVTSGTSEGIDEKLGKHFGL